MFLYHIYRHTHTHNKSLCTCWSIYNRLINSREERKPTIIFYIGCWRKQPRQGNWLRGGKKKGSEVKETINLQKSEMNLNDALHLHFIILYSPCELIFLEKVSRISWSNLFVAVENCSTINFAPAAI